MGSWADALTSGEVSPQANKTSPASLMFMAATPSALAENPHSRQVNCACLFGLSPEVCPHSGHWRLVFIGGTATSKPPRHLVLYSNWRRSSTKRCIQLCSTTPVTAHRQMLLRRMFCGRLLISPHPGAAHHSTSSSATLNSRPHRFSRGSPRPEVRGLCHSRGQVVSPKHTSIADCGARLPPC